MVAIVIRAIGVIAAMAASAPAVAQTYVGPLQRTELPATNQLMMSTGKGLAGVSPGSGLTISGGSLSANVTSVMGRTGPVTLLGTDVTTAIGYTPINKAGDTFSGWVGLQTAATVSAAGASADTATVLTAQHSIVTSVSPGTGVRVPTGLPVSVEVVIVNRGVNTLTVYPPPTAQIESYGTDAPVGIAVGGQASFRCPTSTQCYAGS